MRRIEQEIRSVEDENWKRTDPEKSARADNMIGQLEAAIAQIRTDLDQARDQGNDQRVKKLEADLANREAFLEMARKAASDFTG